MKRTLKAFKSHSVMQWAIAHPARALIAQLLPMRLVAQITPLNQSLRHAQGR